MQDIGFFNVGAACPDLVIENGDLKADNGLETAVMISLYSNRFVEREDLPPLETDQNGWWADEISDPIDDLIGSKFWAIERRGVSLESANRYEESGREALAWMIEDGIAKLIPVESTIVSGERIDVAIDIFRPDGDNIPSRFIWDGQALRRED